MGKSIRIIVDGVYMEVSGLIAEWKPDGNEILLQFKLPPKFEGERLAGRLMDDKVKIEINTERDNRG